MPSVADERVYFANFGGVITPEYQEGRVDEHFAECFPTIPLASARVA
jgi:hypothetical protein